MSSITYLEAIRLAQQHALARDSRVFVYGQDVGAFGGAFKATKNLAKEFPGRVLDSPISEDAMVGLAIGAAIEGMRPIVEMQFADFSTCGFNQIVNQAATLHYRTGTPCPIVVRLHAQTDHADGEHGADVAFAALEFGGKIPEKQQHQDQTDDKQGQRVFVKGLGGGDS